MEKAVLKIEKSDIERMDARKIFSDAYKDFDKKYRQRGAEYFRIFRDAFYNVKSGEELCNVKGLGKRVKIKGKHEKASIYLDYITVDELDYLTNGLELITKIVEDEGKNFDGSFLASAIKRNALAMRRDFEDKHDNMPPEIMPICKRSSKNIKRTYQKMNKEKLVMRSQPKEQELTEITNALKDNNTAITNSPKAKPKFIQTKLFEDDGKSM